MAAVIIPSGAIVPHIAAADSVITSIPTPGFPLKAAFDPKNGKIYVTEPNSNAVAEIDGSQIV
jgi:DNA-binding beta-propeller fold protein YncE